jgi:hypothetical protein
VTQRIPFATDDRQMRDINEWRRKQPDLPSRSEAIRRLIDLALQQAEGGGEGVRPRRG